MSNETARPAAARSGGATPTGIVPSPAASDPLAGEGTSDAGVCRVSSLNCARQVSQPAGRLSGGGNKHQARDQAVAAPLAPPNPKRTRAQQRQANLIKSREWRRCDTRLQALGRPSREEANALVAQFLARRSVTVCPPAADVQEPHNSGVGWR